MALDYTKSGANKMLKSIAENSKSSFSGTVVQEIPIDMIDKNPVNEEIFNMNDIPRLAKTIENEGFSGSIEVMKKADGRYEIISGHRRYEAVKYLNRKTIPAIISKELDEPTKIQKLISSNIMTREMTPLDWARAIKLYKEKVLAPRGEKKKREKCVEYFGISQSRLYRYEAILSLSEELQSLMAIKDFPYSGLIDEHTAQYDENVQHEIYVEITNYIHDLEKRETEEGEKKQISSVRITDIAHDIISRHERKKERASVQKKVPDIKQDEIKKNADNEKPSAMEYNFIGHGLTPKFEAEEAISSSLPEYTPIDRGEEELQRAIASLEAFKSLKLKINEEHKKKIEKISKLIKELS